METNWITDKTKPDRLGYTQETYERGRAADARAQEKRERRLAKRRAILAKAEGNHENA